MPVLVGVPEAHDAAIGQRDATRALDLQEERIERVGDVRDHACRVRRGAALDLARLSKARRDDLRCGLARARPAARGGGRRVRRRAGRRGTAYSGTRKRSVRLARSCEQRLVIAGHQPVDAAVGGRNRVWAKMREEKRAHRAFVRRVDRFGRRAGPLPRRRRARGREKRIAADAKRRPRLRNAVGREAWQGVPRDSREDGGKRGVRRWLGCGAASFGGRRCARDQYDRRADRCEP